MFIIGLKVVINVIKEKFQKINQEENYNLLKFLNHGK